MAGLMIEKLIKLIVGALVVIAILTGLYLFLRDHIIDFFKGLGGDETSKLILSLLK